MKCPRCGTEERQCPQTISGYCDWLIKWRAEIERLRVEIEFLRQSRAQVRAEMKEECAQAAELWKGYKTVDIAAVIRALKG